MNSSGEIKPSLDEFKELYLHQDYKTFYELLSNLNERSDTHVSLLSDSINIPLLKMMLRETIYMVVKIQISILANNCNNN